ncbi:hypothetical protein Ancab_039526 [Ancistrocladus abbreviatus]
MAEEEDSKRKRTAEEEEGDRFVIEASKKERLDDSEPKPKLILKLPAPKVKRRRHYVNINYCCAYAGLEEWNKQQQAKNGPRYELVNAGSSNSIPISNSKGTFYHANFEAKPIGAPDCETQIFFAEIKKKYYEKDFPHVVYLCCPVEKLPPAGEISDCC